MTDMAVAFVAVLMSVTIIGVAAASLAALVLAAWWWRGIRETENNIAAAHYQLDREAWEVEASVPGGER